MAGTVDKRERRRRGSIRPADIIDGAFTLAAQVSVDNLSMPLLGRHLGVGVTSIYWHFRKKDDLLDAMADHALGRAAFDSPYVDAGAWRDSLRNHARNMRSTFLGDPILCDLVLIRGAVSDEARRLGAQQVQQAIDALITAGFTPRDAVATYSGVAVHVRGSVVLERLAQRAGRMDGVGHRRIGMADEMTFEYGLDCLLDHAARRLEQSAAARPR